MRTTNDPTIKKIVEDYEDYVPSYKKYRGEKYEKARRGKTLIPPRILVLISNTANSLEWKAKDLNERERRYEQILRANSNRIYPIWYVCGVCKKHLALLETSKKVPKCEDCKWMR